MEAAATSAPKILDIVQNDTPAVIFTLIGVILTCAGVVYGYYLVAKDPKDVSGWQKVLLFASLACGIALVTISPLMSVYLETRKKEHELAQLKSAVSPTVTPGDAFDNLKANKRVSWAVRLIPYDDKMPDLAIDKLASLSKEPRQYAFVADLDELKGRIANDAVRASGLIPKKRLSAIIFPIDSSRRLFPANARGLLQVIAESEKNNHFTKSFDVKSIVGLTASKALSAQGNISDWAWDNYKTYYPAYCQAATRFLCAVNEDDKSAPGGEKAFPVVDTIGDVSHDWHPLGFAKETPKLSGSEGGKRVDFCNASDVAALCEITDWSKAKAGLVPHFGTRVFLVDNEQIASIPGRMLVNFDNPASQHIPTAPFYASE